MKDQELRDIFLAEAQAQQQELNTLFVRLERNQADQEAVAAIFRVMHTLKGNAMAMGFEAIGEMAHLLEDLFSLLKQGRLTLAPDLFNDLFRANDKLGELIHAIPQGTKVNYRGLKARLEVLLRNVSDEAAAASPADVFAPNDTTAPAAPMSDLPADDIAAETETLGQAMSDFVHVPIRKLDELINLVGELLIERDRLQNLYAERNKGTRTNELSALHRLTADLQYSVMNVRLVQIGVLFSRFHRIVRDVATAQHKQVQLVIEGADTEVDRSVLQVIGDALIHLVRNAVAHGIESPEQRLSTGKPAAGTLRLHAASDKNNILITVSDDGQGIDDQMIRRKAVEKGLISEQQAAQLSVADALELIFAPGFSSAETVTALSGRGVGMEVVRRSTEAIGGKLMLQTVVGQGTTFSLRMPVSMAVKDALLFELNHAVFAVPLAFTDAVTFLPVADIHVLAHGLMAPYREKFIPLIFLHDLFVPAGQNWQHETLDLKQRYETLTAAKLPVIIAITGNRTVMLVVDRFVQQKEIIEKTLRAPLNQSPFVSGATILGDGRVCPVIDIPSIVYFLFEQKNTAIVQP